MNEDMKNGLLVVIVILAFIIGALIFEMSATNNEVGKTIPTTERIEENYLTVSADKVELGETLTLELHGQVDLSCGGIEWKVLRKDSSTMGEIASISFNEATFVPQKEGVATIVAILDGREYVQEIEIFPAPLLEIDIDPWIYINNQYSPNISNSGLINDSVEYWMIDKWGSILRPQQGFIFLENPGNYDVVVEGKALMDGRVIKTTTSLTALPEVRRGYHTISMENENIISFEPWQKTAIELFIKKEIGIEIDLLETKKWSKRSINNVFTKYVFYRDSSRSDQVCYQEDAKYAFQDIKNSLTVYSKSVKAEDGRMWNVIYDEMTFLVYPHAGIYHAKMESPHDSDSDSSGGNGGGRSPSPPI